EQLRGYAAEHAGSRPPSSPVEGSEALVAPATPALLHPVHEGAVGAGSRLATTVDHAEAGVPGGPTGTRGGGVALAAQRGEAEGGRAEHDDEADDADRDLLGDGPRHQDGDAEHEDD